MSDYHRQFFEAAQTGDKDLIDQLLDGFVCMGACVAYLHHKQLFTDIINLLIIEALFKSKLKMLTEQQPCTKPPPMATNK